MHPNSVRLTIGQPQRNGRRPSCSARTRGYVLLDASLAILLGASIAAAGAVTAMDKRGDDIARAQGLAMVTLQGAVNQYLTEHYSQLVQPGGGAVLGVVNPLAPTVTELRALGALKDPLQPTALNGGNYRVKISTFPAGCVAPNCNLDGLVWIDKPLIDWWNNIDYPRLGVAIRAIGSDGATSNAASPGTLQGMQGKWNAVNPVGAQVGILAARTGYNSASFSQFYRRDGSLPMTGDVAANGFNINNAGQVNANTVNLPSGESVQIGSTKIYGDSANAAIRSPSGYTYMQDAAGNAGSVGASNGSFTGTVTAGAVNANETTTLNARVFGNQIVYGTHQVGGVVLGNNVVYLAPQAWAGSPCGSNTITTDPNGTLLTCKYGIWQSAGDVPSGTSCGFSQDNRYDWTGPHLCMGHNPWNDCPSGYYQGVVASIKGETAISCIKS